MANSSPIHVTVVNIFGSRQRTVRIVARKPSVKAHLTVSGTGRRPGSSALPGAIRRTPPAPVPPTPVVPPDPLTAAAAVVAVTATAAVAVLLGAAILPAVKPKKKSVLETYTDLVGDFSDARHRARTKRTTAAIREGYRPTTGMYTLPPATPMKKMQPYKKSKKHKPYKAPRIQKNRG